MSSKVVQLSLARNPPNYPFLLATMSGPGFASSIPAAGNKAYHVVGVAPRQAQRARVLGYVLISVPGPSPGGCRADGALWFGMSICPCWVLGSICRPASRLFSAAEPSPYLIRQHAVQASLKAARNQTMLIALVPFPYQSTSLNCSLRTLCPRSFGLSTRL